MKKLLALLMAALMAVSVLAGCGGASSADEGSSSGTASGDWDYIKNKGELIIGITYFEPMNYLDDNGELTGFETEFAKAVCKEMGVTAKFQKIDWDSKEVELNAKTIDCIWNGMTISDERKENMSLSVSYMENKQVLVTKAENAEKFATADGIKGATIVAEKKSAGEEVAQSDEFFKEANYIAVDSQAKALLEVKSGTADVAVIDYIMSLGTIRPDSDYKDLKTVEGKDFAPEQYGIGLRKEATDTLEQLNAAIQKVADSGELEKIAEKYNLQDMLIVKPSK